MFFLDTEFFSCPSICVQAEIHCHRGLVRNLEAVISMTKQEKKKKKRLIHASRCTILRLPPYLGALKG